MKRRRHESGAALPAPSTSTGDKGGGPPRVEPLDESDQEKLVQDFRKELTEQHQQIRQTFGYLVWTLIPTIILATLYVGVFQIDDSAAGDNHWTSWIRLVLHGIVLSPLLHVAALQTAGSSTAPPPPIQWMALGPLMVFNVACYLTAGDNHALLSRFLLLANGGTLVFAMIHRSDQHSTEHSLNDLQASKYHFKTL